MSYPIKIGAKSRLNVIADVFNLFNRQAIIQNDERYNLTSDGVCAGIPDALCNGDGGLLATARTRSTRWARSPTRGHARPTRTT